MLSDTFAFLWSLGETGCIDPAIFRALALRRWETTLRQRVFWQRFDNDWFRHQIAQEQEAINQWRRRWSLYDAKPDNAYFRPYRPSFWNVRDYPHPIEIKWKSGKTSWVDGQYGKPVYPSCVTPFGASHYLAQWFQLKPPAEQRRLETIGRLYRAGLRDLARRDHFSVWIDKNAQRADGRKVKERGPPDVVERLKEWQQRDNEARRKGEKWEVKTTRQLNATNAFLHDWLRRFPDPAKTITEHRSQGLAALPETAKGITNGSKHVVRRPVHRSLQWAG